MAIYRISIRNTAISFLVSIFYTQTPKALFFKRMLISISQLFVVIQPKAQSLSTFWEEN